MKGLLTCAFALLTFPVLAEVIPLSSHLDESSSVMVKKESIRGGFLHQVDFHLNKVNAVAHPTHHEFMVLSEKNVDFSQNIGESQLPFKSMVVAGGPSELEVTIDPGAAVEVSFLSAPAQPEECRCEVAKKNAWVALKSNRKGLYKIESLGAYRGQALSRVTIYAAEVENTSTLFYPELRAQVRSLKSMDDVFSAQLDSNYDYLIVTPKALLTGLTAFVQFKTKAGLVVKVVTLEEIGADVAKLTAYFKSEYTQHKYKYVLLVGTDELIPNHKVNTSGSPSTPSDYPYFLMDTADMIPDVQGGRVVASTVAEVTRQTQKWMDYSAHHSEAASYLRMIGLASNEGNAPSDEQYVREMETDLNKGFHTTATHIAQNDATSNPKFINEAFDKGAAYLVYVGHGSGKSWGSTGTSYDVSSIKQMDNARALKPVIIDVACQNGTLKKGYFGETFMNGTNKSGAGIGATMYFGGSVNISWHPPAIMAKGLVKRTIASKLKNIGDVLLAGQMYLMENHTEVEAVRDNFEWYHLFGDPSSPIFFQ